MLRNTLRFAILLLTILKLDSVCEAQSTNLLRNPEADALGAFWSAAGEATVERTNEGNLCFVVRNGGSFFQDVDLPDDAVGQYAVLIGRGSSERVNADRAITGLPYLYGYMMNRKEILAYLNGPQMLSQSTSKDKWMQMWGIFKVPGGTNTIRFFLKQA